MTLITNDLDEPIERSNGKKGKENSTSSSGCVSLRRGRVRTEPMARKKPKVAALLSMYWDNVGKAPRGPAPPLEKLKTNERRESVGDPVRRSVRVGGESRSEYDAPQNTERPEDESDREPYTCTHHGTHSVHRSEYIIPT